MPKRRTDMQWFSLLLLLSWTACQDKEETMTPLHIPALMEIPKGFPPLDEPEGNEFTAERWALGKRLFFDPVMSLDSTISCASCHQPALAFSDEVAFSPGVENRPGVRNAPPLFNLAYHPYFTREGGVPTLEMQVLVPIQEHNEFDFNILLIAERLSKDSTYVAMCDAAYGRQPDAFTITRALACFERSLLSGNSRYDQYLQEGKEEVLSESAIRGMDLFFSEKTNCSQCHSGFNFSNYAFENNGLYDNYPDPGRFRLTGLETDRAKFKVPSLRNIEVTAPYMHDGSMQRLSEVIDHYQSGGKNHPNKDPLIQPLHLTDTDKQDLIEFLKSLTDDNFIHHPLFKQ
jgi:cytochrome c peroxidase